MRLMFGLNKTNQQMFGNILVGENIYVIIMMLRKARSLFAFTFGRCPMSPHQLFLNCLFCNQPRCVKRLSCRVLRAILAHIKYSLIEVSHESCQNDRWPGTCHILLDWRASFGDQNLKWC